MIKYVPDIHLEMLRQLHLVAQQKFTFFCENSVAWFDEKSNSHKSAIDLLGDNEYEIKTNKFTSENIISDGCRVRSSNSSTVFSMSTYHTSRLPIVDFKPRDYGARDQQFGFEVGPVCFS